MKYEKYTDLLITKDYLEYEFDSIGPKGQIPKIIQFTPTHDESIVNLAFGNKKEDGSIDDQARDDNKDRNKILATVASVVNVFCRVYPQKWILFTGSTPERTRLYRMAITLNYEELDVDFEIVGLLRDMDAYIDVPFEKGVNYFGFLVRLKNA
jgi:hypothetical protein